MADTPRGICNFFCRIKRFYATPSQDIPCQIYRIPTYMKSYTPTHLDFRCSHINLIIHYFTRFHTSFHVLPFRAYHLGHFDIKTLFLPRSYYNTLQHDRAVVNQARSREPSKDHQGQVSVTTTRQSSTAILDPQGPRSATRGGVGLVSLYTPRARPWCTRASAAPRGSPVWSSALPISAGR
jgi:hypothetical protein